MTQPPEDTTTRGGGGLTQKVGPLPAWGWIAIAAVGGVVALLWLQSRNKAAAATQAGQSSVDVQGADAATVANLQDQLSTVTSQIRDLQGGTSSPTSPVTTDHGAYYFSIVDDPTPSKRYVGIPGVGYYWAPNIDAATQFLKGHPGTIDLGPITQGTAETRFGPILPWAMIGQASTAPTMRPLGQS